MSTICHIETTAGANPSSLDALSTTPKASQIHDDLMAGTWDPLSGDAGIEDRQKSGPQEADNMEIESLDLQDADGEDAMKEWERLDLKNTGFKVSTPPISITPSGTPRPGFGRALANRQEILNRRSISQTAASPALSAKGKKKKRQNKKGLPAAAAVRGFTPAASGDEDSDYSTTSSVVFSPRISALAGHGSNRPSSAAGVSALKLQLDALSLESNPASRSASRTRSKLGSNSPGSMSARSDFSSDADQSELISYDIPLEHDFVSAEAQEQTASTETGDQLQSLLCRKMTASDFTPLKCLGKGTYGTVLLVKQSVSGRLYAQKQFRKATLTVHKKLVEQTKTERSILESVNRHPFVVKLYYAFQDHEKLYLILEYAQGGELFTHLAAERMFSEDIASFYMAELVLALEHLHHTIGVVYRDLKPENCLLDSEGHLLLTDFGLSKVALDGDGDRCNSSLGTIEYMAPEVIQGKSYGKACDWWSLGALGVDLMTGSPPFQANNHLKIQEKILKQKLQLPYYLSPDAKDLLTRLLRKEPNKRLGYHQPKDMNIIKKHRFFRKTDWVKLGKREVDPPIKPFITDPELAENFAGEFTELGLSPVMTRDGWDSMHSATSETNPFGGFSFVASQSLLDAGMMGQAQGDGWEESEGDGDVEGEE